MSNESTVTTVTGIVNTSIISDMLLMYAIDPFISLDKLRMDLIPEGTKTVAFALPTKSSGVAGLTDGTAQSNSTLAFTNTTVTAAEVGILRLITKMAARSNILGEEGIYQWAVEDGARLCLEKYDVDMAANWPNASVSFGTSNQPMTIADLANAISQLAISKAQGPYVALLSAQQARDLRAAILTTTATAFVQQNVDITTVSGNDGYMGTFLGVPVYTNNAPAASGGNKVGVVMTDGAQNKQHAPVGVGYMWLPEMVELSQPQYPGQQIAVTMAYGSAEVVDAYYVGLSTVST